MHVHWLLVWQNCGGFAKPTATAHFLPKSKYDFDHNIPTPMGSPIENTKDAFVRSLCRYREGGRKVREGSHRKLCCIIRVLSDY